MSSNLKVNTILPSTGTTVTVSGISSVTGSISAGSSITGTTFYGSGANLTSLPSQVTISNNGNDRIITGGSGTNLNGEANLQFDGTDLYLSDNIKHLGDPDTAIRFPAANQISFETAGSERLRIRADGNVGVGSDNPQAEFEVFGYGAAASGSTPILAIRNGYSGTADASNALKSELRFLHKNHNASHEFMAARIEASTTNNYSQLSNLIFYTANGNNGTERFRITASGQLRLMDGSSVKMSVYNDGSQNFITSNSGQEIKVSCGNGDSNGIEFWDYTGGNKRCQIDGHGIKFNTDTAEANALDDYEEGSYTPTLSGSGWSYTRQYGFYRKVGTMVHVSIWIGASGGPNNSSSLGIGLPFTSYSNSSYRGGISGSFDSANFDNSYTSGRNRTHINANVTHMQASFPFIDNGGWTSGGLTNAGVYDGFQAQLSGTYMSNS